MGIDHSNPYIHSTTVLCDWHPKYVRAHFFRVRNTRCSRPMFREFRLATFISWMVIFMITKWDWHATLDVKLFGDCFTLQKCSSVWVELGDMDMAMDSNTCVPSILHLHCTLHEYACMGTGCVSLVLQDEMLKL